MVFCESMDDDEWIEDWNENSLYIAICSILANAPARIRTQLLLHAVLIQVEKS